MMRIGSCLTVFFIGVFIFSCTVTPVNQKADPRDLFAGFQHPPAEARPFVRWWWNGNHLQEEEIKRQLDVLEQAGFGGIEINPIEMPEEAADIGTRPITWLSKEWNDMLLLASREAKARGMIADMIVGSGWPFGGEFVQPDETIQRVIGHKIRLTNFRQINVDRDSLIHLAHQANSRPNEEEPFSNEILFISLMPANLRDLSEVVDLTSRFKDAQQIDYTLPAGDYVLSYGVLQKGHRQVMHGALGAAGPVMNHYDADITRNYLERLRKISEDTGVPLKELVRALFCDSIELAGANWTDGLEEIFYDTYSYDLKPWLPFIFYVPHTGYQDNGAVGESADKIRRVRYDYNNLLVRVFLKNFTQVFRDFAKENGLLARYQAYGTPFNMGLMEGNMIPDIPEGNNWLYTIDMDADEWKWNQGHGYLIWNLYAASGGHLNDRKIIGCEAMTNNGGVFKTSLEDIKQHDDMNFITGINHTVLHGYNYSPPGAGFPGWIRYGAYFSEQNTLWPYLPKWIDYNARLSYVFQNSEPVKKIAIVGPSSDVWGEFGLSRVPFHMTPWYGYRLWESLSQAGSSSDYISDQVIAGSQVVDGQLKYGPMSYETVILAGVTSIDPAAARVLNKFVSEGGRLVMVDEVPNRAPSFVNAEEADKNVRENFSKMLDQRGGRVIQLPGPRDEQDLLSWTANVLRKIDHTADVVIERPDKDVFQIRHRTVDQEIYFFVNSHREEGASLMVSFPVQGKTAYRWNPEDATRQMISLSKDNKLALTLRPLESFLLVFESEGPTAPEYQFKSPPERAGQEISGEWNVTFHHMNGKRFERKFNRLKEFGSADDPELRTFAGTAVYKTTFDFDGKGGWINLGEMNRGVAEILINGEQVGTNWYGKPVFPLPATIKERDNKLEIRYTTILANYALSLKDNPTAAMWTSRYKNGPGNIGLEDVYLIGE